ncbi:MAG TPA: hypothetical protein VLA39_02945 [Marinobacterium sp.]|nr:hypothetical protein [Marinobacterium sp.]
MSEEKQFFDFSQRSADEQRALLTHTWCDQCQQADLGMIKPQEYVQFGIRFVEGECKSCGQVVFTEISDDEF